MNENDSTNFASAVRFGKEQTLQMEYKGTPVFVIPNDMKVATLENLVEKQQDRPYKLNQSVELLSADSFIEYYNRFATESSTIFVDVENANFTAILDYHDSPTEPAWKNHRASYSCPLTKEWGSWINRNNDKMSQEEFALFIEDNLAEISEPNGAEMLEIAASPKAKTDVEFKSNIRLDNGQVQFNYTETVNAQAGVSGQFTIPEKITIIVKPFLSGAPYEMQARFRYRVTANGLSMWYTLIRPHLIKQDAVSEVIEKVKASVTSGQVIEAKEPR